MKILDVGSGTHPYFEEGADVVHMDAIKYDHVEIVQDLIFPWKIEDDTFDKIILYNVLEHIEPNLIYYIMNQAYRVLKQDGKIIIHVPYHSSGNARGDPTHISQYSIQTTRFFDNELTPEHPWRQHPFKFKRVDWDLVFHPWWLRWMGWVVKRIPGFYDYHLCYIIQPAELQFTLKKEV